MRNFVLLSACALLALVVPLGSSASSLGVRGGSAGNPAPATPVDGTLTVRSATGTLSLSGGGSVLGQVAGKGRLMIEDSDTVDGVPVVSGYEKAIKLRPSATLYIGTDLRFRVLGGQFKLRVVAAGVSLSFVGRGIVTIQSTVMVQDGAYSLDGGDTYRALGLGLTTVIVGMPPSSTVAPTSLPSLNGLLLERYP